MVRFCLQKPLVKEKGHTPTLPCLAYKQKWPPKRTATHVVGKLFGTALSFQEPPRHTKRTEGRPEQHRSGATIGNSAAWAKQRPPDKNEITLHERNRDTPLKLPMYQTSPTTGPPLVYVANRYEYKPLPIVIVVLVPEGPITAGPGKGPKKLNERCTR